MKSAPLPLEDAQARLLALITPLDIELLAPEQALGRYLAEPLRARRTQPAADQSAMDGYAVPACDLAGPWRVVGESAAGHPFAGILAAGTAARISTGALLPGGAEAVILQEDITREGDRITMTGEAPSPPGKHIRREGMDFRRGDLLLEPGTHIGPAQLGLAITAGHSRIAVRRLPRIAIIDSGDELASGGEDCAAHQIPASNGAMLAALAAQLPCTIERLGPVADDLDAIADVLARAEQADLIVTSGGASVGDHDLIRPALEVWGARIDFWRIAIKPGKPLLVATRGKQMILGLPGNPVSSHVTAFLFMLPLLRALSGAADPLPRTIRTLLAAPLGPSGSRREFLRARWNGDTIAAQSLQDSGAMSSLANSNALIDRAADAPPSAIGEEVRAYLLENGSIA
ncbi:MAG: molybdopterin molybdotransferase MoeA [Novosphingobium sp.]